MRYEHIPIGPTGNGRKHFGESQIDVRKIQGATIDPNISPLETAHHEAAHVVMAFLVGITVIEATDKPGPGYGGYTLTTGSASAYKSALVFAAAEAQGSKGTGKENESPGSDMWWIRALGFEPSEMVSRARNMLSNEKNQSKILAVATKIRNKRFISGSEAEKVAEDAEKETVIALTVYDEFGNLEHARTISTTHHTSHIEFLIPEEKFSPQEQHQLAA
jgi:hypothetical protein